MECVHRGTESSSKPHLELPFVIELFCGTARVTAALNHLGLQHSFGVDHIRKTAAPVKEVDLTSIEGAALLHAWVQSPYLAGIHAAPPCGTCSRAREIPVWGPGGQNVGPPPLRSSDHPEGIPGLRGTNQERVSQANVLYENLTDCIRWVRCHKPQVMIVVENPANSWFWHTRFWRSVEHHFVLHYHQACAYGGERPKRTALASTHSEVSIITRQCPEESSSHRHAPWGKSQGSEHEWATADETAYPPTLAAAIALAFAQALLHQGWQPPASMPSEAALIKAATNAQPRASQFPSLVPEYQRVCVVRLPTATTLPCSPMARLPSPWQATPDIQLPAHAQLLRSTPLRLKGGGDTTEAQGELVETAWGIPFSETRFVEEAIRAGHPRTVDAKIPTALEEAIQANATLSAGELADLRASWLRKWADRAVALQDSEAKLKASLPDHLREILKPKRLLLWKEILEAEGYPDPGVFDELCQGTELCGEVPRSKVFEADFKPAKQAVSTLLNNAPATNKSIVHRTRSSGSAEVDLAVYSKTLEEVEKGWLMGPLEPASLDQGIVISRRFGLQQPDKVRPIDDMSVSGINATVQAAERPRPHSVDVIAAITLRLMALNPGKALLGKAFDLKSAYRQLGIHPGSLRASYIAVYNPHESKLEVFQMLAVPFGATRAVYSFLRVVRALWWIGCSCLKLTWSCYFDDFILVTKQGEELSATKAVEALFKLLGWRYAEEWAKAAEFDRQANQ